MHVVSVDQPIEHLGIRRVVGVSVYVNEKRDRWGFKAADEARQLVGKPVSQNDVCDLQRCPSWAATPGIPAGRIADKFCNTLSLYN